MYADCTTDVKGGLADKSEEDDITFKDNGLDRQVPTPELNNNYVNSSVMLSKGNDYSIGKAIKRKRNADGNAIGRMNNNLILDTREYPVDFDDGKISELKANVIT